jgi:hypothetical protein
VAGEGLRGGGRGCNHDDGGRWLMHAAASDGHGRGGGAEGKLNAEWHATL